MAQQTINVGAAPNDGTGTPLRTAFQYTNSNFSELYTATGPSGNNIVVPGSATITGDLTVATSALKVTGGKVGIGLVSPNRNLSIFGASNSLIHFTTTATGPLNTDGFTLGVETDSSVTLFNAENTPFNFYVNSTLGMTLNSTGLGVGDSPSYKLHVAKTTDGTIGYFRRTGATINPALTVYCNETGNTVGFGTDYAGATSPSITFTTGGVERLRIDATGNVGIGVTPSAWGNNFKVVQVGQAGSVYGSAPTGFYGIKFNLYNDNTNDISITNNFVGEYRFNILNGSHIWFNKSTSSGGVGVAQTLTQAMTLDASGNLLVGCTTAPNPAAATTSSGFSLNGNGNNAYISQKIDNGPCGYFRRDGTDGVVLGFYKANSAVGTIAVTATVCTFNSISDYRLKESVKPITNGLARVNALKPASYKWKSDGSSGEGFLAHELAEVVPAAVTGEKDAVNEDGSIKSQGVDMSRVVPILVAAIKELTARVQTLEAK